MALFLTKVQFLSLRALERTFITEDPKENPITEDPIEDLKTEDPREDIVRLLLEIPIAESKNAIKWFSYNKMIVNPD